MNQKFVSYLNLLESRAPESQKADFRRAIELYTERASQPQMEAELPLFGRNFSGLGKTSPVNTFHTPGQGIGNAKRSPEMFHADAKRALAIRKAEEDFPDAAATVTKAAETEPGKVDAWVDARLKPVINRARKADGLGGVEGSKAKYKSDYKAAKAKYREEDIEAQEAERVKQEDELARSREIEETRKAEEARKTEEARQAEAAKKREELGSNRDYKYSAEMPLNATDKDINSTVATAKSDDLEKGKEVDKQFADAEKWWSDNGDNWGMADVAAVNIKGLRAAFESVYGDSKEFSDDEIRTICESCYRRSHKK